MSESIPTADATRVASLAGLLADLPPELWVDGGVSPELWDKALLDPARDMLSRTGKGFRGRLVETTWRLAGGEDSGASADVAVAIELIHAGSLIVDDIEDDSRMRRGLPAAHHLYGVPSALNMGNWLYFLALGLVARLPVSAECRAGMFQDIVTGLLRCHQGQALDLAVKIGAAPRVKVVEIVTAATTLKTGALMELAARAGGRAAGGSVADVERLGSFGREMGVLLQMLDDWSGVSVAARRAKGIEDVQLQRPTWPWAWIAEGVGEPLYSEVARETRRASSEWEAGQVLDSLAPALTAIAPARIEEQLDRTIGLLRENFGRRDEVELARAELVALVEAYV